MLRNIFFSGSAADGTGELNHESIIMILRPNRREPIHIGPGSQISKRGDILDNNK